MVKTGRDMRQKKKSEFLTEVELEFMTHLWALGEGSVRDVIARLAPGRNLAYTSAATILRIMEQKEFVTSENTARHSFTNRPWPRMSTSQKPCVTFRISCSTAHRRPLWPGWSMTRVYPRTRLRRYGHYWTGG